MNNIAPIGRTSISSPERTSDVTAVPKEVVKNQGRDQVEISAAGHLLSRLDELPDVRHDLVERIRDEILAGTYESEEKLTEAIDELIVDLVG